MVQLFCVKGIVYYALKAKIHHSDLLLAKKMGHERKQTKVTISHLRCMCTKLFILIQISEGFVILIP